MGRGFSCPTWAYFLKKALKNHKIVISPGVSDNRFRNCGFQYQVVLLLAFQLKFLSHDQLRFKPLSGALCQRAEERASQSEAAYLAMLGDGFASEAASSSYARCRHRYLSRLTGRCAVLARCLMRHQSSRQIPASHGDAALSMILPPTLANAPSILRSHESFASLALVSSIGFRAR